MRSCLATSESSSIAGLVSRWGSHDDAPDVTTDAGGDVRRVREVTDSKSRIHAFVDQIHEAIKHQKPDRDARILAEKAVDNRPKHFLAKNRRCGDGHRSPRRASLRTSDHVGLLQI